MRKLIILFIVSIILASCTMDVMNEFQFDYPRFDNMLEACEWIHKNIEYKYLNEWRTPQEILNSGYGSCSDMSVLLMAIVGYQHYNFCSYFVAIDTPKLNHAVVEYNGLFYDCVKGKIIKLKENEILYKTTHSSIMYTVYNDTKVLNVL